VKRARSRAFHEWLRVRYVADPSRGVAQMMGSGVAAAVMVVVMVAMMAATMGGGLWGLRRWMHDRHRPHGGS
jgi:hypothetical protein